MTTDNPNIITECHDPEKRLSEIFHLHVYEGKMTGYEDSQVPVIFENAKLVYQTYQRATSLLREAGFEDAIERLTAKLIPSFGKGKIALRDQKVGGIPDLRNWLYTKVNSKGVFNLDKIWPRCGACHERMKFVGQFDLLPWVVPIHAVFGSLTMSYGTGYVSGPFGSYGRLTQHSSIFRDMMFHTFMCPIGGQHFNNPNYEAQVLITNSYLGNLRNSEEKKVSNDDAYLASIPKLPRASEHDCRIKPRKITGWQFRLELDSYSPLDKKGDTNYEREKSIEKLMAENPDTFAQWGREFTLLGEPQSQQQPQRFYGARSANGPRRMTPFLSFDDESADFTYQLYTDFQWSEGYIYHCKVDGSCT